MGNIQKTNYKALIITGVISLAVAVGGNILVNKLSEEKLLLTYDLTVSETFSSSKKNIRIATVTVSNSGSKSIDDVSLTVELPDGNIQEHKISGLPVNSYNIDKKKSKLALTTKYLNPEENFYIQLLLNNPKEIEFLPFIDLRGRGTLGTQVVKHKKNALLEMILTIMVALTTAMLFLRFKSYRTKIFGLDYIDSKLSDLGDKHGDEQRDVVAYILSMMSLGTYADEIRYIPREISYWSICDHLTQKWLDTGDKTKYMEGAKALEKLIDYAQINDQSILLIKSNIARLYKEAGDINKSKSIIDEILLSGSGVIQSRVSNLDITQNS